uniref:Zinc finger protein 48 n=1 Tax=Myotis lucifugus TaxID=59463 RepID=G1QAN2_MYOLU
MERAGEPWGPDLHGREEGEPPGGARTGLGGENVEMSRADEFEPTPQEDDLGFKEEDDLAPGHEVGNASLKPEGIQTWDDLWVQREGPGKPQARDRGPRLLGEPRWGQASDRADRARPPAQGPPKIPRSRVPAGERPTICGTHRGEQPPRPMVPRRPPSRAATAAAQGPKAQDKPYICTDCGKRFVLSCSLLSHQRSHLGPKPFGCDVCGKEFARGSDLVKHLRVHTGEKPYLCPECGKGFADSSARVKHLRTHTGERPHACPECDCTFSLSSTLLRHRLTHMEPQDFSFPGYPLAPLIPSPPPSSSSPPPPLGTSPPLTPRSPSHSGDGPFGLPGLEPEPRGPQAGEPPPPLAGDKPHKCPECGKGFRRSSDLVKHHRVHTGEKPYLCPECGKGFADSSARVKHLRTHRGEQARPPSTLLRPHNPPGPAPMAPRPRVRAQPSGLSQPHVCGFCGKEFPRSSDLVKHRRTHTGEKPYKCAECGKGFADSSARIKHQRGHLVLRPFGTGGGLARPLKEEPPVGLE